MAKELKQGTGLDASLSIWTETLFFKEIGKNSPALFSRIGRFTLFYFCHRLTGKNLGFYGLLCGVSWTRTASPSHPMMTLVWCTASNIADLVNPWSPEGKRLLMSGGYVIQSSLLQEIMKFLLLTRGPLPRCRRKSHPQHIQQHTSLLTFFSFIFQTVRRDSIRVDGHRLRASRQHNQLLGRPGGLESGTGGHHHHQGPPQRSVLSSYWFLFTLCI